MLGAGLGYLTARSQSTGAATIAEAQHKHERELARGERLYDRRASIYEEAIRFAQGMVAHVRATEPLIRFAGETEADLPPMPAPQEQWELQARLHTHGSVGVGDALDELVGDVRAFFAVATTVRTIREHGGQMGDEPRQLNEVRGTVGEALQRLQRRVSEELSSL